jgi:hypothetical protein
MQHGQIIPHQQVADLPFMAHVGVPHGFSVTEISDRLAVFDKH